MKSSSNAIFGWIGVSLFSLIASASVWFYREGATDVQQNLESI
jgi:hypothetical protein